MRPTSRRSRRNPGFTLVELLVAGTVTALVLTSICAIYFSVSQEWEHQQGQGDALAVSSRSCARLSDYISQATSVQTYTRFTEDDSIVLNMPLDSAYGTYVPAWTGGKLQMRSGQWIAFYLSDSTGNYLKNGNILWAATVIWSPFTVTPDTTWTKYSANGAAKYAPLRSLRFNVTTSGGRTSVQTIVIAAYKFRSKEKYVQQSLTTCLYD